MKFYVVLGVILAVLFSYVLAEDNPTVETTLGRIKGTILKTLHDHDVYAFLGIRYAEAPVGEKRFKPPVSVPKWAPEILDATKDGYSCPQPKTPKQMMSEDCLVLNVFTTNLKAKKPVVVYIHGGANYMGSSNSEYFAGPKFLLDNDIVLVTMNYRLGALGFLSTQSEEASGNYGYLDQLMVLQWVKDHIANFGGNPEEVTIFGISAGGMAVTLHMASPLSKGLFHRAIAMSGSATNHFNVDNLGWTRKLAELVACPIYNPKDVVECLRNVSWEKIIDACETWEPYGFIDLKWNYEVDGHFLLDDPTTVFAKGDFHKVPILTGITKDELDFYNYEQASNTGLLNDISLNFDKYAPNFFTYKLHDNADQISKRIQKFYLKNEPIQNQAFTNFGNIFSDAIINHGVHRLVHLARHHVDVFYYRFDYMGRFSRFPDENGKPRGVQHADDYQFLLNCKFVTISLGDPEVFMIERIGKWFSSFAKNGVPSDAEGVKWLPSTSDQVYTMYNDKDIRLGEEPFSDRFSEWDEMFPVKIEKINVKEEL